MSLLDNGPDTMLIWPAEEVTDGRGNIVRQPSADPVEVTGRLQERDSSEEVSPSGVALSSQYKFIARSAPAAPWSRLQYFAGPNTAIIGIDFDVVGEPTLYAGSRKVTHISALLRARTPRPV